MASSLALLMGRWWAMISSIVTDSVKLVPLIDRLLGTISLYQYNFLFKALSLVMVGKTKDVQVQEVSNT